MWGFLHPGLVWGALTAALPLVVYLLFRRRPQPVRFGAIELLLRAEQLLRRRFRWRQLLLLLSRAALLLSAALALARPLHRGAREQASLPAARATALILDASGSMNYQLEKETLFERARLQLLKELDQLEPTEPAMVMICGAPEVDPPGAVSTMKDPPSWNRTAQRRQLMEARVTLSHADLSRCSNSALKTLGESAAGKALGSRLAIATDMAATAWSGTLAAPDSSMSALSPELIVLDASLGQALPNAAVRLLEVERDPAVGPRGYRFIVTLTNSSDSALKATELQFTAVNRIRGGQHNRREDLRSTDFLIRSFVEVPAHGTLRKTFSYAFPSSGSFEVSAALPADALNIDDRATIVLWVPDEVQALVVNGSPNPTRYRDEAYFVETALGTSTSLVRAQVIDPEHWANTSLDGLSLVMLLNLKSIGARGAELRRFVESGGGLFLSVGDEVDPDTWNSELGALLPAPLHLIKTLPPDAAAGFTQVVWAHPAFIIFSGQAQEGLLGAHFARYFLVKPDPSAVVLARYGDGSPAIIEAARGRGKVVLYTSTVDGDWADWNIRTSFVPSVQRLSAYLAGPLAMEAPIVSAVVGTPLALPLPLYSGAQAVLDPTGQAHALNAPTDSHAGPSLTPNQIGIWSTKANDQIDPKLAFAAGVDPRESDTSRLAVSALETSWGGTLIQKRESVDESAATPVWSWLLLAMVFWFVIESALGSDWAWQRS